MPLPLIPLIIGVGSALFAGRKAHDAYAAHGPLCGCCSHCGDKTTHEFAESGMNWKRIGGMGVLLGLLGLGLSSALVRNIYKCTACLNHTLPCRYPACAGMARSGDYYDDEFCGQCIAANDDSKLFKAMRDQQDLAKIREIMQRMQQEIETLYAQVIELQKGRSADTVIISKLMKLVRAKEGELQNLREAMGAASNG